MTIRFGEFELDPAGYELRRKGRRLRLARQPMDLLLMLAARPRQLVSRDEISRRLWAEDVFVDVDAGIHTAVLKIRQALGDSPDEPRFVETVAGKGYRFIAPLQTPPGDAAAEHTLRHNLRVELTTFVGRRHELLELHRLVHAARLVSLIGTGGVGKTRIALRLASESVPDFRFGVWVVDLAPLTAPHQIAEAIASVLGVREGPNRSARDAIIEYARGHRLLLVIDNCEHLVDGCAELIEALLSSAPALRVLATSRETLGVPGETVYRVPPLPLPDMDGPDATRSVVESEATRLFLERASSASPGFTAADHQTGIVARICRRLDGIPLAIELAAARVSVLTVEEIERRLDDRFALLKSGPRTAVPRQRTLEATVAWSYQLLADRERQVFNRLSVFPASWTLEAAAGVCAGDGLETSDVLDTLSRLVSKSLVTIVDTTERRYRLLETVRQYAFDRMDESGGSRELRDRHFRFFHHSFHGALAALAGPQQVAWLKRLEAEQDNVRAALEWGLSSPGLGEQAVELTGALFWFWTKRGLFEEGRRWLERAETVPAPPRLRARTLIGLSHMDYFQGRHDAMEARFEETLALGRQEDDAWVVSFALSGQGLVRFETGDLRQASALAHAALEAAQGHSDVVPGSAQLILGNVALIEGDHDRALAHLGSGVELLRRAGEKWALGILLSVAAGLRVVLERFVEARAHASEALALCQELDDPRGIAWTLDVFAGLLAARGHHEAAVRLWGASDGLLERVGGSLVPTIGWIRERYLATAETALGSEVFEDLRSEGRAMPGAKAIALAREQALLLD